MIHAESDNPWAEYLEALNKCCDAVRLVVWHTKACAKQTERAGIETSLAAHHVGEYINGNSNRA